MRRTGAPSAEVPDLAAALPPAVVTGSRSARESRGSSEEQVNDVAPIAAPANRDVRVADEVRTDLTRCLSSGSVDGDRHFEAAGQCLEPRSPVRRVADRAPDPSIRGADASIERNPRRRPGASSEVDRGPAPGARGRSWYGEPRWPGLSSSCSRSHSRRPPPARSRPPRRRIGSVPRRCPRGPTRWRACSRRRGRLPRSSSSSHRSRQTSPSARPAWKRCCHASRTRSADRRRSTSSRISSSRSTRS